MLSAEAEQNALFDKKLAQEEIWIRKGIEARRTRNEGRLRALKQLRTQRRERLRAELQHLEPVALGHLGREDAAGLGVGDVERRAGRGRELGGAGQAAGEPLLVDQPQLEQRGVERATGLALAGQRAVHAVPGDDALVDEELARYDAAAARARLPQELGTETPSTDLAPAARILVARSLRHRHLDAGAPAASDAFLATVRGHVGLVLDLALLAPDVAEAERQARAERDSGAVAGDG